MRLFSAISLFLFPTLGFAQTSDVLLLYSNDITSQVTPLVNNLSQSGNFASVDTYSARGATPSQSLLNSYDAVLVISWNIYSDATLLGNRLADYVDQGGNVVVMAFANIDWNSSGYLRGRWETGSYNVIQPGGSFIVGASSLGQVLEPGHAIMNGVTSFSGGGDSWRSNSTVLSASGLLIAEWADGKVLAAVDDSFAGGRADLNFYPMDDTVDFDYWDTSTDGYLLIQNSLEYVLTGGLPNLRIMHSVAGELMTIEVRFVSPGANIVTMLSSLGAGPTPSPFGDIAVSLPWRQTPQFPADANGVMNFSTYLPLGATGRTLYCHSVELDGAGGGSLSNPIEIVVQ